MYKVVFNVGWGTRDQTRFPSVYFKRKPSKEDIISAFARRGYRVSERYDEPQCSGMIVIMPLTFEDQEGK